MSWSYLVPTLRGAPKRLFDWDAAGSITTDSTPDRRLGIYCAAESHRESPWLVGSFAPAWDVFKAHGEVLWTLTDKYATGDGHLLSVAGAREQVIADGERVPTDEYGIARPRIGGYARLKLKCGHCGLRRTYRSETVQAAVEQLVRAGVREVPLSMFAEAVDRAS